ncbi:phosphoglycerate dehydrogenase-like enzyme [Novosphingobium hassiacum]|uniref:Phosphoglycerate dehydrogenase-like enzyme n=1 Tax=Novosphingobium hassiacum TaxID=173676 RepID=A0A7W5ZV79_9SPHN|nr:D-2-hydroxyacid dehydrogenase [Novosphingobium hassiacum]MBB3860586.1 phosphoglycerate dehydrogenase-like enzyme [Novosphingobium hassiacum]
MTVLVMNSLAAPMVQSRLPDWVKPRFFSTTQELLELAPDAEIGWMDLNEKDAMVTAIASATRLKWLNSIYAGVDGMPLDMLRERGVVLTNGVGINAITIAEYVVMALLTVAKGYREVVRAQDRHEWLLDAPGKVELAGSRALIIGYGAIGQGVERRLAGFDVDVVKVRRSAGEGALGPEEWRGQLGAFDWVILAVPATAETDAMIGAAELAAMKPTATLINVARGSVIDQDALVAALTAGRPGSAFLDVTTPEPLPADHPLWSLPNAHVSMHLSGRSQTRMFERSVTRFLENLDRFGRGEPLQPQVDLSLGY